MCPFIKHRKVVIFMIVTYLSCIPPVYVAEMRGREHALHIITEQNSSVNHLYTEGQFTKVRSGKLTGRMYKKSPYQLLQPCGRESGAM